MRGHNAVGFRVLAVAMVVASLLAFGGVSTLRGDTYPAAPTPYPSNSSPLYPPTATTPFSPPTPAPYSPPGPSLPYSTAAYPGGDSSAVPQQFSNGSAQLITQPPPGGRAMANVVGAPGAPATANNFARPDTAPAASDRSAAATVFPNRIVEERPIESTWYYRLDYFHWNERLNGTDFVNENGPISTVGYQRRNGPERFRFELFGGTVAYDGGAQYIDSSGNYQTEPYHLSNGTDYLGVRGEYELLIEPSSWTSARLFVGAGTRFWLRDLHDAVLPDAFVSGYQETWWTFYPYVGLETKVADQNVFHVFGSARIGLTAFTYQYADIADPYYGTGGSVLHPRCGVTSQAELGVACRRFSLSAFTEVMTWGESAIVRDSLQPASLMFTVGGRVGYTF